MGQRQNFLKRHARRSMPVLNEYAEINADKFRSLCNFAYFLVLYLGPRDKRNTVITHTRVIHTVESRSLTESTSKTEDNR